MQRTVYSHRFTYANVELVNDELVTNLATVTVHEVDEQKALKKAQKMVGAFKPLKVEKISALYVLDDEIFFKYATVAKEGSEE